MICFQGHAEDVLAVDNLLGHLPMEMTVTAILLAARIPVDFLNKLINVCAGRQLVSRKEGEMMVQGWAPTLAVNLCPKTPRRAKPTEFICSAVSHMQNPSVLYQLQTLWW